MNRLNLVLRWIRLRAGWLLVPPFLWLARPTPVLLGVGAALALTGLALRAWAAGVIHKERELTVEGPYAHTRNPLYLGSFLLGVGVAAAGGRWLFLPAFVLFFALVYGHTIAEEVGKLDALFGQAYRDYAGHVPLLLPRVVPYRPPGVGRGGFSLSRYRRNREWEAALGTLAGFFFLTLKMLWT